MTSCLGRSGIFYDRGSVINAYHMAVKNIDQLRPSFVVNEMRSVYSTNQLSAKADLKDVSSQHGTRQSQNNVK